MKWQPIETAPKDGTWILVAFGDGHHIEACTYIAEWKDDGWIESYSEVPVYPSHWMPMPPDAD